MRIITKKRRPKRLFGYLVCRICECILDIVDLFVEILTLGRFSVENPFIAKSVEMYLYEDDWRKFVKEVDEPLEKDPAEENNEGVWKC